MNNVFIEELVRNFKNSIHSILNNEIEIYFSKDVSNNEHIKYLTSKEIYNVHKLNEEWIKLCDESKFSDKDRFYAIKYLMTFLIEIKPTLEYKIQLKDLEENKNSRSSWFTFEDNLSYKFIFDYFKSELLEYSDEGVKKNSTNDTTVKPLDFGISWKKETTSKTLGYKTDLKELLFVLYKSKRIIKNNEPIEHKELTRIFNELLGTDVNIHNPSDKINRRSLDKTYISELNEIMNEHLLKNPEK